ncbi:hypothetical protein [Streptomyces sp. H51]|uniref:hypothetical protein n=1 Tax=Streptomyces sp. H51 TaxID=3111770 RepID=UPI002D784795|nr:hypothetical protein [Streptomyces sp. H51]
MRRTTHRTALALAALALAAAGCGGCGGGNASGAGSGKGGGGGTVSPSSAASTAAAGCADTTQLDAADSGRTVCLAVGGTVRVSLDGTAGRPWKPVAVSGTGLRATNSGFVLRPGDASAAFEAVSAGRSRLSSQRPLCAQTGRISCKGIQEWWVTVVVR